MNKTIKRDSVFGNLSKTPEKEETPGNGQILRHTVYSRTRQTAVYLLPEEMEWLDRQIIIIKNSGYPKITRSALIRSFIQAAKESKVDFSGGEDEYQVTRRIVGNK